MDAMRKAEQDVLHESGNPVVTITEYDGRLIEWTDQSNSPSTVLKKRTFGDWMVSITSRAAQIKLKKPGYVSETCRA